VQENVRASSERFLAHCVSVMQREHNDLGFRSKTANYLSGLQPVHNGHGPVQNDYIWAEFNHSLNSLFESRAIVAPARHGAVFGPVIWWLTPRRGAV
jgi:hypothetical protein